VQAIEDYEALLAERFRTALREIPGVKLYAAPDDVRKTPTIAFLIENRTPREFCEHMAEEGFFVADGHFYASTLAQKLGIRDKGGWIRAGLAPYNTGEEVEGFIELQRRFVEGSTPAGRTVPKFSPARQRNGTKDVGSERDKYFAEE
jgi:selenocysteine lyase/cysteine desulfurase